MPAAQKLLAKIGWSKDDVDLWEVNEAFAVVPMAFMHEMGLPRDKVNVNGGACALGHPIGASGARIMVTLLNALETRGLKRGDRRDLHRRRRRHRHRDRAGVSFFCSEISRGCGGWPPHRRFPEDSDMTLDYPALAARIDSLTEGETDTVALMATVACEVHHSDDRFDWTGFYRVTEPDMLKIGPYQGGHGCLVIPFSRGVCGAAARTGELQLVADVDAFPGHIACASSTRSELVLPVRNRGGDIIAVFDIDSDQPDAFTSHDAEQLSRILDRVFAG